MFFPVLAAAGTTMAAFFPILSLTGSIGQIIDALPVVMIVALTASLIECFLVLPMHLLGALARLDRGESSGPASARRTAGPGSLPGPLRPFPGHPGASRRGLLLPAPLQHAAGMAVHVLDRADPDAHGWVGFEFFAQPETDMVFGNFALSPGAPRERTGKMGTSPRARRLRPSRS